MNYPEIKTERLILRSWQKRDLEAFAAMNADPRVMEYFPDTNSFDDSNKEYQKIITHFEKHNYGWWAVSERNDTKFIGFIGLRYIDFPAAFTPAVEVAWRLAYDHWGKGYATEGAKASLKYGFEILNLPKIVAITSIRNARSRAVMEKIGMHHYQEYDFDHPKLPEGHPLRRHVFYCIDRDEWIKETDNEPI